MGKSQVLKGHSVGGLKSSERLDHKGQRASPGLKAGLGGERGWTGSWWALVPLAFIWEEFGVNSGHRSRAQ